MPAAPSVPPPSSRARACALVCLGCCVLWACSEEPKAEAEPAARTAALGKATAEAPADPPAPAQTPPSADGQGTAADPPKYPQPGFSKVTVEDKGPVCVFSDYVEQQKADFPADAKKQKLRAKSTVVFGTYAPWCVHESCDDRPSLQCWVEREGETLLLHSKYWGDHKDGATCTEECRKITAGCETPELEAGKYTVQYGDKSFELKMPSVLRSPCHFVE